MWDCLTNLEADPAPPGQPQLGPAHVAPPDDWDLLRLAANKPVTCLAATDEVVVNGFNGSGSLRFMRMG
jgi:hypothetical protein